VNNVGPSCVAEEAHWVIPHQETGNSDSSVPDKLSHYVGKDESGPVVSTAFALSVQAFKLVIAGCDTMTLQCVPCFVELSLNGKHWNDLEDERDHIEKEDEHAEHLVLEALLSIVRH
jgi:hypothetical protein